MLQTYLFHLSGKSLTTSLFMPNLNPVHTNLNIKLTLGLIMIKTPWGMFSLVRVVLSPKCTCVCRHVQNTEILPSEYM